MARFFTHRNLYLFISLHSFVHFACEGLDNFTRMNNVSPEVPELPADEGEGLEDDLQITSYATHEFETLALANFDVGARLLVYERNLVIGQKTLTRKTLSRRQLSQIQISVCLLGIEKESFFNICMISSGQGCISTPAGLERLGFSLSESF